MGFLLILIDMEKGFETADKNGIDFKDVVLVNGNVVEVKLGPNSGYTYSFFNDVSLSAYPDKNRENEYTGLYVLNVKENCH